MRPRCDDIHVAAGEDGDHALVLGGQVLERRYGEQAGVLHDHLVVLHHVEEAADELLIGDANHVVEVLLQIREDFVAHFKYGGAVGDGVGMVEFDGVASFERAREAGCALGLHADHADLGVVELGEGRDAAG